MSTAQILVVDDEVDIRSLLEEILTEEGYDVQVAADAQTARTSRAATRPDLVLLDIWMPDTDGITLLREWSDDESLPSCPVVMMSGHGTVETAVEATRLGAFDFIEKPVSLAKLLRVVERALEAGRTAVPNAGRRIIPSAIEPIGKSRSMQVLREQVERVAKHDTPVMMIGEAGVGRESFSRYLHALSGRSSGPFVTVVAAALTEQDAAIRLLGRQDPGGESISGFFDQARGGVLFLSEVADLCQSAQKLLLATLEAGSYVPVGGVTAHDLDVRIVSSAQPGLTRLPATAFRLDLRSMLDGVSLIVPPLREYAEDVPELLRYFVDRLVDSEGLPFRRFGVASQNRLRNYPWPGNVSELKSLVRRLLIMSRGEEISLEEIEEVLAQEAAADEPLVKQDLLALPLREAREQFERAYLQQQLVLCDGKVGRLAKRVGMERTHLYRKLRALGIDFRQSVSED